MSQEEPKSHIIFIANLVPSITLEQLQITFKDFGKIISSDLIRRRTQNTYAFIEFDDMRDAVDALQTVNQRQIRGKKLRIEYKSGIQNQRHEVDSSLSYRADEYNRTQREMSRSRRKQTQSEVMGRGKKSQSPSSIGSKKKQEESRSRSRSKDYSRNQREMMDTVRNLQRRVKLLQSRIDYIERKNRF